MKINLILDRIEEGIAVLVDEAAGVLTCSVELLPDGTLEGDAFTGVVEDGAVVSLEKRENPRAGENKKRLLALFNKNKNKR